MCIRDSPNPNPKRIKSSDQCKRKDCKRRGTSKNHTHEGCKFKESEFNKNPFTNVGKAPPKKTRNAKTNASQPAKNASASFAKTDERKCYTCGKPGHLSNVCPEKTKIKAHAQSALYKNKSFMALLQTSFADANQEK